ncbi:MAG: hypothetical protein ACM3JQ_01775 [Candidatus Eiseniibacteriota bacterium]
MSEKTASLLDCIKMLLLSSVDNVSHVTLFIEKDGMVRVPFHEFIELTRDIRVDSRYLDDSNLQQLMSIFGDNFCFVLHDGSIKYVYSVESMKSDGEYGMVSIDPVGESSRWDTYDDDYKKSKIRSYLQV